MSIHPKFTPHAILKSSSSIQHTIDIYLDYVCPYSAKLFKRVYEDVIPSLEAADNKHHGKVQFIFRHQVQPWHPSSTLTHEASLAVERLSPSHFWPFSAALFARQVEYFDVGVVNETRNETYARLAKLAGSVGVDEGKVYVLLEVGDKPVGGAHNIGNEVTNDLKLFVKTARAMGVHVSPTVVLNGVIDNSISSGWSAEQWGEWLDKNIV